MAFNDVIDSNDPFTLEHKKLVELIEKNLKEKPKQTPFFEYYDKSSGTCKQPVHQKKVTAGIDSNR